ncbi:DUF4271 domain-containing protein [Flaviaesturariibacter amylovorans]|uniref:DUF4271 domain-containing protein n=1 Tax=Flaviaesturariibacter amylovorans TaxID=1084520 RepID=A0ABP8GDC0_9BACT
MKTASAVLFLLLICCGLPAAAQRDSTRHADTAVRADTATLGLPDSLLIADSLRRDTLVIPPPLIVAQRFDSIVWKLHPFFRFDSPLRLRESVRVVAGKESLFYITVGLLLLFAVVRNAFGKYVVDLFRLFFRATLKQRQAKEQLLQSPLPSLLLNLLFVLSAALFLNLLFARFALGSGYSFWELMGYTALGLSTLYLGKFLVLKLVGWIFGVSEGVDAYIFIVFTTNKIIGMMLLPFVVLLAFTGGVTAQVGLSLSLVVLGSLYLYRYFISWTTVQRQVRLNAFHFLLYLLAFEVVPLLLINKVLFRALG